MYTIMARSFPFWYFLCVVFLPLGGSFNPCKAVFHVIYQFGFSITISAFLYLAPKLFCLPRIWLSVGLCIFFSQLGQSSSVVLEFPVLFVLFIPILVSFLSSFFRHYFLILSPRVILFVLIVLLYVMVPTLRTKMNSSNYYE